MRNILSILSILFTFVSIQLPGVCQLNSTSSKQVDAKVTAAIRPLQTSIANVATSLSSQTSKQVAQDKTITAQALLIKTLQGSLKSLQDSIRNLQDTMKVLKVVVGSDFSPDERGVLQISQSFIDRIKWDLKNQ